MYDCGNCPWSGRGCLRANRTRPRLEWRECPLAKDAIKKKNESKEKR